MTDPRELIDAYAAKKYGEYSDRMDEIAPELFAALRDVLKRHDIDRHGGKHCVNCFDHFGEHVEYPCPTVQAIANALEAK